MKIEEGKYYRSREGKKVGPMEYRLSTTYPWISPKGALYRENGKRYEGAEEPTTDLISEWKEEEPAMDYATMNEFLGYLHELRAIKRAESDEKVAEIDKLDSLILKIESHYPKPDSDEEEK